MIPPHIDWKDHEKEKRVKDLLDWNKAVEKAYTNKVRTCFVPALTPLNY